jgi:hypothetical protein
MMILAEGKWQLVHSELYRHLFALYNGVRNRRYYDALKTTKMCTISTTWQF